MGPGSLESHDLMTTQLGNKGLSLRETQGRILEILAHPGVLSQGLQMLWFPHSRFLYLPYLGKRLNPRETLTCGG